MQVDLIIDEQYMADTVFIDYVYVDPTDCYIEEGCVGGPGLRKVLRFGTKVGNQGNADLSIGFPGGDDWVYAACHDHYHFEDYAFYELLTPIGRQITTVGYKNGWCVMDLSDWQDSGLPCDVTTVTTKVSVQDVQTSTQQALIVSGLT